MSSAKPPFETIQFPERGGRLAQQEGKENGRAAGPDLNLLTPDQIAARLGVST